MVFVAEAASGSDRGKTRTEEKKRENEIKQEEMDKDEIERQIANAENERLEGAKVRSLRKTVE